MARCLILIISLGLFSVGGCGSAEEEYVVPVEAVPAIPAGRSGTEAPADGGGSKGVTGRPSMPPG